MFNLKQVPYWRRPEDQKEYALNVDGSSNKNTNRAGFGVVIRDHQGNWIRGFTGRIDYTNCLEAELIAILNGLSLAWFIGIRDVSCRSDCLQALKFITDSTLQPGEYYDIVDSIRELLSRDWFVSFEHTYREGNQCADYMAKLGANGMNCMKRYSEPPIFLDSLLMSDASRTLYRRA
jgi:ribonuclease HI